MRTDNARPGGAPGAARGSSAFPAGCEVTTAGARCGLPVVALADSICVHEHIDKDGPLCAPHLRRAAELYCRECWELQHACPLQPFNIRELA